MPENNVNQSSINLGLESNSSFLNPQDNESYLAGSNTQEILFIASDIPDSQKLIDGIYSDIEVVKLDLAQNGIFQISEVLARHQGLSAIHIVTHASDSNVQFGSTSLTSDTLLKYESNLAEWGNALSEDGDMLFYGCNLTASDEGVNLVKNLGEITKADIAASDDLTGSQQKGGDWEFETKIGSIEAKLAFSHDAIASYGSVFVRTFTTGTYNLIEGTDNFDQDFIISGDVTLNVSKDFKFGNAFTIKGDNNSTTVDNLTIKALDKFLGDLPDSINPDYGSAEGDIEISGDIGGDGLQNVTLEALNSITLNTGASIDTAGDIKLTVKDTDIRLGLSPWGFSNKAVGISVTGATLKGNTVTLNATAEDYNPINEAPSWAQKLLIQPVVQSASYFVNSFVLPASVQVRGSDADITLDNANIIATGKVEINSKAVVDSSVNAISSINSTNPLARVAIAVGRGVGEALTTIKGNTSITAGADVKITSTTQNTTKSFARVFGNVELATIEENLNNAKDGGGALAISTTETTARTILENGSSIVATGNVTVDATGKVTSEAKATTSIFVNGSAGLGLSFNVDKTDIEAKVDGAITAGASAVGQTINLNQIDNTSETITLTNHGFQTGDEIIYSSGGGDSIGGLTDGETYTVFVVDNNNIKLVKELGLDIDNAGLNAGVEHSLTPQTGKAFDAATALNVDTDEITISNHGLTTGQRVTYSGDDNGSDLDGLSSQSIYYAIATSPNTIKLAATIDRAAEGVADIDLIESDKSTGSEHFLNYLRLDQQTTNFDASTATVVDLANNEITLTDHGLATGQVLNYSPVGGTPISGLTERGYFVIVVDDDTIQLAKTYDDAFFGNELRFNAVTVIPKTQTVTGTLVKDVATGKVYEYTGAASVELILSSVNFAANNSGWTERADLAASFVANPSANKYNSDYAGSLGTLASPTTNHKFTYASRTNLFDPTSNAVNSDRNTITLSTPHTFQTGDTVFYEVDPTFSTTENITFNLSFDPATDVDLTTDTITIAGGHNLNTGDAVIYEAGYLGENAAEIGQLQNRKTYYAIKIDDTTIKLATTADNANNNVAIDLQTGAVGSLHNLKTFQAVKAYDTPLKSLEDGTYYHVVVIDANTIQLTETLAEATNATPIDLNTAVATGTNHSLKTPNQNSGISIKASLDAKDRASSKGATGSNPKIRDLIANPDLLPIASAIGKPNDTKNLLKGGTEVKDKDGNTVKKDGKAVKLESIQNNDNSFSLGLGFGLNFFDHTVLATVGSNAVLKSSADIKVDASVKQPGLQVVVDAATGKDEGGVAIATAFGIGLYTNTVKARVYDGAELDASGKIAVTSKVTYPYVFDYEKEFSFKDDPTTTKNEAAEGPGNIIVALNDLLFGGKLGLDRLFNTFVTTKNKGKKLTAVDEAKGKGTKGTIQGGDFGLAVSATYLRYDNTSEAIIGYRDDSDTVVDGVLINQDNVYRTANQSVLVDAKTEMILTNATGILNLDLAVDVAYKAVKSKDASEVFSPFGNRAKNGVGASVLAQTMINDTIAKINDGVVIHTGALGDTGVDPDKQKALAVVATESIFSFDLAQGGGEAETFGFTGSAVGLGQTSNTIAQIESGVVIDGGPILVKADSNNTRISIIGSIQKTDSIGVGVGVGANVIVRNTKAIIGKTRTDDDLTPGNAGTLINVTGDIDVKATNRGNIVIVALAGVANGDTPTATQPSNPNDFNFNLAGNVAVNDVEETAQAYINDIGSITALSGGDIYLYSKNDTLLGTFSGGFAISVAGSSAAPTQSTNNIGLFGSYSRNDVVSVSQGFIVGATVKGDAISLEAYQESTSITGSVGLAGSKTTAAQNSNSLNIPGSLSQNVISNTTEAFLEDATLDATGDFKLIADDTSEIYAIAGAFGFGIATLGGPGTTTATTVGFSAATNDITNKVRAYTQDSLVNLTTINTGAVEIKAISKPKIFSLTIAGSVSGTSSAGSSVSVAGAGAGSGNTIDNTISAFISGGSVKVKNSTKKLLLTAEDQSEVEGDAGGFGLALAKGQTGSGSGSVGASITINKITNEISAYIDNANVTSTGNIEISATSTAKIRAFTIAGTVAGTSNATGVSGSFAGAGAGSGNEIINTITANLKNDAVVQAVGKVALLAKDGSTIIADAGGGSLAVAVGGNQSVSLALGLALSRNTIKNTVEAYIDDASVNSLDNTDLDLDIQAISSGSITARSVAVAVSISQGQQTGVSLSGGGAESTNIILNKTNAFIKNSILGDVWRQEAELLRIGDVVILADSTANIEAAVVAISGSVAISGESGGAASVGAAVARNFIGYEADGDRTPGEVQAYIQNTSLNINGDLSLTANAKETINAKVGAGSVAVSASNNIGIGLSGAGVITENKIATLVKAYIDGDGATGIQANNISLIADDTASITAKAGAASLAVAVGNTGAGAALSIGVALARNEVSNEVEAFVKNADQKVKSKTGDVVISATTKGKDLFNIDTSLIAGLDDAASTDADDETTTANEAQVDADADVVFLKSLRDAFSNQGTSLDATNFDYTSTASVDTLTSGTRVKREADGLVYEYIGDNINTSVNLNSQNYSDRTQWKPVDDITITAINPGNEWSVLDGETTYVIKQITQANGTKVLTVFKTTIEAVSVAASIAVGFSTGGAGVALSGAGAESTNVILTKTNAYAQDSVIESADDVSLNATNTSSIIAKVAGVSAAVGVGVGTAGVGASIGVAVARNQIGWQIADGLFDYTTGSGSQILQTGDRIRIIGGARANDIYEYIGEATTDAVDLRTQDYANTSLWKQVNLNKSPISVQAFLSNTSVTASGDLSLTALSESTIDAGVGAGSVAIGGGGNVGVGISGAGVSSENIISTNVRAFIDGDGVTGIQVGKASLFANDNSSIKTTAAGVSIAGSFGGAVAGVSVSIGVSLARNTISNEVFTYIENADNSVIANNGAATLKALENAKIDATSVAVSIAAGFSGLVGVGVSGAGGEATNIIGNQVKSYIVNSTVNAKGVDLDAQSTSSIKAVAGAISAAVSGGLVAASGSLGVSLARNFIGVDSLTDSTGYRNQVMAYIDNSTITSTGDVQVKAKSTETIDSLSFAGSVAVAVGIGGAVAGSGADTRNKFNTKVYAYINDTAVTATNDIIVTAESDSQITRAEAVGVAVAVGLLGAASVGSSIAINDISNDVQAYINSTSAKTLSAGDDITVAADVSRAKMDGVFAVAPSVAVALGLGLSGSGIEITNTIANQATAKVTGAVTLNAVGDVQVLADEDAYLSSEARGVSISVGLAAASLGVSLVTNKITSTIKAFVDNDTSETWETGDSRPTNITSTNTTIQANSTAKIEKTKAIAVSTSIGLLSIGATGSRADADIQTLVTAYVEGVNLTSSGDIEISAITNNKTRTSADGGAVGALAVGGMVSDIGLGQGNSVDEVVATLGNGTQVTAKVLRIKATSTDDLLAESLAAGGGAIAVAGAESKVTSDLATLAKIGNNAQINVNSLTVTSIHEQDIDAAADSFQFALAVGSGAGVSNNITSKANVDIGTSSMIQAADNVIINAINRLSKDQFTDADGRSNLRSGSAAFGNLSVLASSTDIGTASNPFEAVVNVGSGTSITVQGTNKNPGLLRIETLNDVNAFDSVRLETVAGYAMGIGLSKIDATTKAGVNLNGATLENKSGDVYLTAKTNAGLRPSTNLLAASYFGGVAASDAKTTNNATNQIKVDGATIKGSDIYLFAGKDSFGIPDLFDSSANSEITSISFGPALSIPVLKAEINETNQIDLTGVAKLQALEDVNLIAEKGLEGDSKRSQTDGLILNLSLIPYGFDVPDGSSDNRVNQVNIGNQAVIEAGINNKSVVQVKPLTLGGVQQLDPAKLGTELSATEKQALGLSPDIKYEYGTLNLDQVGFSISTGTVIQVVTGANQGGTVGNYYRYKPVNNDADTIILEKENFSNTSRWENLGATLTAEQQETLAIYNSDVTLGFKNTLKDKFYVIKPVDLAAPTFSYVNIGNLLIEQRETVLEWIANHAGNAEAIARYQVQLEEINQTLEELGLFETVTNPTTGQTATLIKKELDALFLELPNIYAAPGSIFIEDNQSTSSTFTSLLGNRLIARAGAEINILNQSPFTLRVNDTIIRDNKRVVVNNGAYTVLEPGNVYFNNGLVSGATSNTGDKQISIVQDAFANSQYNLGSLQLPSIDQDIFIVGDVINESGDLLIDNKEGSINVSGEIRAENVTIRAARDFNLNVEDWLHTNQDPRQYVNYDTLRSQVFNTAGTKTSKTFDNATDVPGNLQTAINRNESSILAQGAISVTARYLNVNGLIQSGVDTVTLNIASTFNPGNITRTFVDDDGNALAGISFGADNVPVDGYFDAQNQAIVVEDIIPQGGRITLAGKIFSTGNGQLKVANGYANVNINNDSNYKLILNRIDNTTNRQGKITIIDTESLKKTEYAVDGSGVKETRFDGALIPASGGEISRIDYTETGTTPYSFNADIKYQPQTGLKYVWTEGQEKTEVVQTKYEKNTFNLFGDNDFADLLARDESYAWRTVEFRDEQPLLESESVLPDGTNNPPTYSTGKAYTIEYEQRNDETVDLIKDTSLVKYNGVVYRYVGNNADLKLSTQNYTTDTANWAATTIDANTFVQDPAQNKFNSDYENSSLTVKTWTTGGGWLRKKTYHTLTTQVTGIKDFYTHTLKADYAIDIDFLQGSSAPQISISSDADIYLQGNIDTPDSGTIDLSTSNGSVQTTNTNAIFGDISNIDVSGDFKAIVSGSDTPLNVTADGDIEITVVSEDNQSSSLVVGQIISTNGNVIINAPNGITAENANSQITGNQVELRAEDGAIGTTNLAINIDSNTEGDGGFAAKAEGSINVVEKAGDLKLTEATSWNGDAAVESSNGDVRLETVNGSILDGIKELFTVSDRINNNVDPSVQALIDNGTVSADALQYPISPGLYSALYPNADFLGLAQNTSAIETPNIIGNQVTLIAKANANEVGQIGRISDTVSIDLSQGYAGLTTAEKQILSTATAEDILGVVYETYQYIGSDTTGADVSQGNFSDTSKWQKLTANFITESDRLTTQSVAITQNQIVLVQYSAEEYGLYKYLGQSKTLDLASQDYDTVSLWQKVTVNHSTNDNGTPLAVIPNVTTVKDGDLLYRYVGANSISLNLTNVDYANDSNWQDITFTQDPSQNRYESTYGNSTTRVNVVGDDEDDTLVKAGNTIYRYIGEKPATLDLRTEDYSNTAKWQVDTRFEIADNFVQNTSQNRYESTFRNQDKTLLNGQLVENRFVVSRLALQLQDDVDLEATNAVTIEADNGVTAQTTGSLQINRVKAGDNVRLVAEGAITDLGTDSTAAITSLGDLTLRSEDSSITGANNNPLRIQVAPTGQLSVRAQGSINLQQVSADTTVDEQFQAISDLYVTRANAGGEVNIAVAEGNMTVGKVVAGNSVNLTAANNIFDAFSDEDATVVNISTATGDVNLNVGSDIGTASNFLDVEIPVGQFSATAGNDVFLHSVFSLNVADIISTAGDVTLDVDGDVNIDPITATSGTVTINADGSIIDALNDDNSEINAVSIKLTAGGEIGNAANPFDIDSSNATPGTVAATANGTVYLIETDGDLQVDLIQSQTTDVTLLAKNGSILDANGDAVNIEGVNINLTAITGSIGEVTNDLEIDSAKPTPGKLKATATTNIYISEIAGGLSINSVDADQGDVRLTVKETAATGEDLLLDGTAQVTATNGSIILRAGDNITADANSLISAQENITILGDYGNLDPLGTTINLNGRILATNVSIQGEGNADLITLRLQELVGNTVVLGGDSNDEIIVDSLPSLDKTRRGQSIRNTLTLDGQTGSDNYTVNITGSDTDYIINVFDTGVDTVQDKLTVYGTSVADNFLLRAAENRENGVAFVAALKGDSIVDVERINYTLNLEKLNVNTEDGDDTVTLDDNWAETTISSGLGNDNFQVGQIFKSERDAAAGVAAQDVFETVQTTRGYLSNGVSFTTTLDGDAGNDTFTVYRNKAVLNLNGGDNDDLFVIRAFAEEGSTDNNVTAGEGADTIQYVVNSPVNVNGGDGNDTLKIIGTEFADKFVVTADAIFGAGRTINYTAIETVIIDGAEGDDEFYVLSTNTGVVTKLFGGLGSDKFSLGGDAPQVVAGDTPLAAQEGSHKVDGIQGQLFIDGFGGEGSTSLAEPVMLPGETNLLASTGDVIAYSAVDNTMTVATADLLAVVSALNELVGKTLEISRGNGLRRFWQIIGVTQSNGQAILTLQNPSLPDPTWGTPDSESEYAINNLSANFFVNEDETLDVVTAFNDGSTANTPGTLTATTLTGLGMGAAGVTYNNFEVVEVLLGTGNDQFTVENTADGAITAIHGGGGDDTITVSDRGNIDSRGKDAPLAIFGDTSQDGSRYTDTPSQVNPGFARSFTNPGNDTVNASASQKSVSIYGGAGNDSITGSQAGDQIAGGSGDDNINSQGGADHIYGDSGFNLDTATRELTVPNVNTSVNPSRDSLTVGNDTIDGGSGDNIILGDYGIITQTPGTPRILTTANVIQVETANPADSGNDTITTGNEQDIILAGNGNDTVNAGDGNNIVIGDNGKVIIPAGNIHRIETTDSNLGGDDTITTGSGEDIVPGGFASDNITTATGNDIVLGDNGYISYIETDNDSADIDRIKTTNIKDGGNDTINAGAGNDFVFGGVGDDQINTGEDNDLIFGDNGVVEGDVNANLLPLSTLTKPFSFTSIDTANTDADGNPLGGDDIINAGAGQDIAIAGQGNDTVFGEAGDDDIIGGHNVAGGHDGSDVLDGGTGNDVIAGDNASILRRGDALNPRIRTLNGQVIYDSNGTAQVNANPQLNPTGIEERNITLFDHSDTPAPNTFGNDNIAGGAQDDVIFGQLGDDTIQGDGAVSINTTNASVEDFAGVGTDGDDYIEGNGGKDLIYGNLGQDDIVGGSSNLFSLTSPTQRPDDADTIFGGAGTDIARNDLGDESANGHARDADYILGDNGNILRLVGSNGQFLNFSYDVYGDLKLIPRAFQLLDYTQGGAASDRGTADILHGESGDDVIHGMTGNDVIFGEGQDDDIYGGTGSDRIYGGAGEDGILGDDGIILTSRNGLTESLYGVNTPNAQVEISIPGPFTGAWVYITGRLLKTVNLLAFNSGNSDIIYGGLGDDFLHGGAGDDGVSGAEAQAAFYNSNPVTNTNPLGYDPVTRKLAAYDANNPMKRIEGFFLNFDAVDNAGNKINDGKDNIFGDLGNDWLVSGTQNDRLFGGLGDDVLNADDNHDTAGGLNNQPDTVEFADRDFAFGGGGLDVLIANTGGDRLFDWNGEYNSYWVPFSPFGNPTVVRSPSPQIQQFLLALGKSSGADQTLTEPNGELGLTTSGENGSPRDPQPGNSNAQRDTQGAPEDDRSTAITLTGNTIANSTAPIVASSIANSTDVTLNDTYVAQDPSNSSQKALFIGGSNNADNIEVRRGSTTATIRVLVNGVDKGEFARTSNGSTIGRIIIYGNNGNDTITINSDLDPISTVIYGDAGNDTIRGGSGNNFIDGGDGNDFIYGSSVRDILIGSQGADSIDGDKDDDVLIAGSYRYSQDLNAIAALLAAWIQPISYTQRVSNLKNGVGFDSVFALNAANIVDDFAVDSLTINTLNGLQGQDWFIVSSNDQTDEKGNETTN